MNKVLFLCAANVWRSQMAEWFYNHFTKSNNAISAAMLLDRKAKFFNMPSDDVIQLMREEGIDISKQTIKVVTKEMCESVDKIISFASNREFSPEVFIEWVPAYEYITKYHKDKFSERLLDDPHFLTFRQVKWIRNSIKKIVLEIIGK